jgi:hypothetical protein
LSSFHLSSPLFSSRPALGPPYSQFSLKYF